MRVACDSIPMHLLLVSIPSSSFPPDFMLRLVRFHCLVFFFFIGHMLWFRSPTAAALELESSAPPMDLDRPQGSPAQPLDLPQPSSMPSFPAADAASPLSLAELAQSSEAHKNPDPHDMGTASESAMASKAGSAMKVGQAIATESANAESAAEAEPAVAAESALKSGSANDTSALMSPPASVDKPVQRTTTDKQPRGVVSPLDKPTQAVAGDASVVTAVRPTEQSGHAANVQSKRQVLGADVQGERQVLGEDGGGERQVVREAGSDAEGSQKEEVVPSTEDDLDSAMQELAQEVRCVPSTHEFRGDVRTRVYSTCSQRVSCCV